ncbi:MAG TPA: hypothetical protein PKD09_16795 [Aggregatilinea sp.]|uniref:hypothetical protein n=1 Tax=Aggregatilinea sp. TaxID=2806333 RepID=UPI002BBC6537|nr:hypothetical protein [Aggregatilinea sp.]HML23315.1 hypothetical protein [Aggregatilinea sp.]
MNAYTPARSFLAANGKLAARHLRFPRGRIGQGLVMEDGRSFTIFREIRAVLFEHPAEGATFRVRFRVAGMSPAQNKRFSLLPIPFFAGLPGFRAKLWALDEASGEFQGLYWWATVEDAERYAHSFAMRFMTRRAVPGSVAAVVYPGLHPALKEIQVR